MARAGAWDQARLEETGSSLCPERAQGWGSGFGHPQFFFPPPPPSPPSFPASWSHILTMDGMSPQWHQDPQSCIPAGPQRDAGMQGWSWDAAEGEVGSHLLHLLTPTTPTQSHPPAGLSWGWPGGEFWGGIPPFGAERSPHAAAPRPSQRQIPDIFFSFLCSQEIHFSWEVKVSPSSS